MTTQIQQTTDRTQFNELEWGVTRWEDIQRGMRFRTNNFINFDSKVIHEKHLYDGRLHYIEVVSFFNANEILNQNYLLFLDNKGLITSLREMRRSYVKKDINRDFSEYEVTIHMALGGARR